MNYKIDITSRDKSIIYLVVIVILIILGFLYVSGGIVKKQPVIPQKSETEVFVKGN